MKPHRAVRVLSALAAAAALAVLASGCASAPREERILFVGNSLIYTNDLPAVLSRLIESRGPRAFIDSSTAPSYRLLDHAEYAPSLELIAAGDWNYIFLNENNMILIDEDRYAAESIPGFAAIAQVLGDQIDRAYVFVNWGFRDGFFFAPLDSYENMQRYLTETIERTAAGHGIRTVPIGAVWEDLHSRLPDLPLWLPDRIHPTAAGTYATACALYAFIYGESPAGSTYFPPGVDPAVGAQIQSIAFEAVRRGTEAASPADRAE